MNTNFPLWIKVVTQVGFPIVIAIYFIIILYPTITDVNAKMEEHIKIVSRSVQQIDEQTRLLKAICRNVAKNDFEKANCDIVK